VEQAMSNGFFDVYVLADSRSRKLIESFLTEFLKFWEECAEEYEIPQYSDNPEFTFSRDTELMDFCEKRTHVVHTIYWKSKIETNPKYAIDRLVQKYK